MFTGKYPVPEASRIYTDADFGEITPISAVKQMYIDNNSKPYDIIDDCVIKGQIISSDKEGNVYKSFYIQDETAGIEIKMGKNGLYNDYKVGQYVYVDCCNLTVGAYEGMIQIGYKDETGEYETAYLEHQILIDLHVFQGAMAAEDDIRHLRIQRKRQGSFRPFLLRSIFRSGRRSQCLFRRIRHILPPRIT